MTSDLPPTGGSQPPPEPPPAGPSSPAHLGADTSTGSAAPSGPSPGCAPEAGPGPTAGPGSSGHAPTGPGSPGPGWSGPGASGHGSDDFFNRIRSTGATRPDDGRWVAGVAVGLGRRWDVDPILVRGSFVALTVFGGIGIVFYGLAWLLLPHEDGRIHLQQAIRGDLTAGFAGALLLSLTAIGGGGSGPWDNGFWFGWAFPGGLLITAAVIFGIWWMAKQSSDTSGPQDSKTAPAYPPTYTPVGSAPNSWPSTEPQAGDAAQQARTAAKAQAMAQAEERTRAAMARRARTAPSKMIVRLSLGVALLVAAAILVIGNAGNWSEPVGLIATASALAVIAAGVIASGLSGRRAPGLAAIGVILTIASLVGAAAENAGVRSGQHVTVIGKQTWEPHTVDAAQGQYNLGVGEATLELTDPAILSTATTADPLQVRVRVGAGHLTVIVPDNVTTQIDLEVGAGDVSYPDGTSHRFDSDVNTTQQQRLTTGPNGSPRMIVDVEQGAGQVDLRTINPSTPSPAPTGSAVPSVRATPTATATN